MHLIGTLKTHSILLLFPQNYNTMVLSSPNSYSSKGFILFAFVSIFILSFTSVILNAQNDEAWSYLPEELPKDDLVYLGDNVFSSVRFGRFTIDQVIPFRFVHDVIGPFVLKWENDDPSTNIVILDTEWWGPLITGFGERPNDLGIEFPYVRSNWFNTSYQIDVSGTNENPFFNQTVQENGKIVGWQNYIGLPYSDYTEITIKAFRYLPDEFPRNDLSYIGDNRITSERFGNFKIDRNVPYHYIHDVLGALMLRWKNDNPATHIAILDTELWGNLETSIKEYPSALGLLFPYVRSQSFNITYFVDISGNTDTPFYSHSLDMNGNEIGWQNYIGIPSSENIEATSNALSYLPDEFPKGDLVYAGNDEFQSKRFGNFRLDRSVPFRYIHEILGPLKLRWQNDDPNTKIVYLDTEWWGPLETSFSEYPSNLGLEFPYVISHWFDATYLIDMSGEKQEPFYNHNTSDTGSHIGWKDYIGASLMDGETHYYLAESFFMKMQELAAIISNDIDAMLLFKSYYDRAIFHCDRTEGAWSFSKDQDSGEEIIGTLQAWAGHSRTLKNRTEELLKSFQPKWKEPYTLQLADGVPLTLQWIEGYEDNGLYKRFLYGTPETEISSSQNMRAVHAYTYGSYWMGKHEITRAQWRAIMGEKLENHLDLNVTKWRSYGDGMNKPATYVSWNDAMEFCRRLSEREKAAGRIEEGWEYTLPLEMQWEFACRAGSSTRFHYGDSLDTNMANFNGHYPEISNRCPYYPHGLFRARVLDVGSFAPNAWGLYDMHGNVGELCQKDPYYRFISASKQPNLIRGGDWGSAAKKCRVFSRRELPSCANCKGKDQRDNRTGFRIVLSLKYQWYQNQWYL